jgi:outer membrane biosynthesis protein TonB
MPWSRGCEEDRRFYRSLGTSVMVSLALGVLIGTIALPMVEKPPVPEVPERMARLVREARPLPPPEPVETPAVEEAKLEKPPEPQPEPEPVPLPKVAETKPVAPSRNAVETTTAAEASAPPKQAAPAGLLAFRESLAARANTRPTARLGAGARLSSAGATAVQRSTRSMVASSAPGSSGGINIADISRDVGSGGQDLGGVEVSRVASSIGGGTGADRPVSGGVAAGRTDEEIQIVFDRYKAALYRLYNRELRNNPTLRGQLVLRLTIEPDGSVSLCQLHSSSMDAPALSQQIVDRVRAFDFGSKPDIAAMTIIYPIDFLPAA